MVGFFPARRAIILFGFIGRVIALTKKHLPYFIDGGRLFAFYVNKNLLNGYIVD